jgi:hypothetical protein
MAAILKVSYAGQVFQGIHARAAMQDKYDRVTLLLLIID